jgi:hypothetical protein
MDLSAQHRAALRKAITSSPRWEDYKKATGQGIATMGKDDLLAAAKALDIDVKTLTSTETESTDTMKKIIFSAAEMQTLKNRFETARDAMHEDAAKFCDSVFKTVMTKQEGCGTSAQFDAILRNVEKAEKTAAAETTAAADTETKAAPVTAPRPVFEKTDAGAAMWEIIKGSALEDLYEQIAPKIDAALSNVSAVKIEMMREGVKVGETDGHHHPLFSTLCRTLSVRMMDGFSPCVWIAGPAGSGKTHSAKTFAKAAGLPFYYNGALNDAFALVGYQDGNGHYHRTAFRDAYEHGGVYLFDEVDASDNAALLALNGALANGICSFPDGLIERHPDCHIIATGNTHGHGATAEYVGRAKIDAAFLDRFGVRLNWTYDTALETAISGNIEWTKRIQAARIRAGAAGLKVLITPRASITGAALIAGGFTPDEAAEITYLANLSAEQRKIVEGRA